MDRLEMGSEESHATLDEQLTRQLQRTLSAMISDLAYKSKALLALVKAMHNEIVELKRELLRLKTTRVVLITSIHC